MLVQICKWQNDSRMGSLICSFP